MTWPTTSDGQFYVFEGRVLMPIDPATNVAQILLRPQGGLGVGIPAIAQGDPGITPTIDTTINFTELAYNDATPASASWTETSPDVYKLNLTVHEGDPGASGTNATIIGASDLTGTPAYKKIITVNSGANGFDYSVQKVGDRFIPASISNTSSGNPLSTLCSVAVPAQSFDWRPHVEGQCVITGTGADVKVDLIARLNNETSGNIVGRALAGGIGGINPPTHHLVTGPPAGSADAYDKVTAGNAATIYLRAERQTGADTFTTSNSTTSFYVRVCPIL